MFNNCNYSLIWLVFERIQQILHTPYDGDQINKLIKIIIAQSRVVIALSRVIVIALSITCYRYFTVTCYRYCTG